MQNAQALAAIEAKLEEHELHRVIREATTVTIAQYHASYMLRYDSSLACKMAQIAGILDKDLTVSTAHGFITLTIPGPEDRRIEITLT